MALALLLAGALLPGLYLQRVSVASLTRARDAWLVGLVALGVLWLGARELWLGVLGAYLLVWWVTPAHLDALKRAPWEKLRTLVVWAAIAGTWWLALEVPEWVWGWLPTAWGVWAWLAAGAIGYQWWVGDSAKVRAWHGMRSIAGSFLVLVLPLLPWWLWAGPLLALWLTGPSWVALVALSAASCWLWPSWYVGGPIIALAGCASLVVVLRVPVAGRAVGEWAPRGDSLDSLRHRWALLTRAWQDLSLWGAGPGGTRVAHLRAQARGQLTEGTGTLHCEPAQLVSEYGIMGALALGLFAWRVGSHLTLGDPWSACVVSGAVLALGTMSLRVAPIGLIFLLACAEVTRG